MTDFWESLKYQKQIMNRIVLIGNGFDLAHGMPTRYIDFIDSYFRELCEKVTSENLGYVNEDVTLKLTSGIPLLNTRGGPYKFSDIKSYKNLIEYLYQYIDVYGYESADLKFTNSFFETICTNYQNQNYQWVDIENDYFDELIKFINKGRLKENIDAVNKFNDDVKKVEQLLGKYLTKVEEKYSAREAINDIYNIIYTTIDSEDIAISSYDDYCDSLEYIINEYIGLEENRQVSRVNALSKIFKQHDLYKSFNDQFIDEYIDDIKQIKITDKNLTKTPQYFLLPKQVLFLNFNYTATDLLYKTAISKHISIHGELDEKKNNPIILGFGDEFCDEFPQLENLRDNSFVKQIKSSRYSHTNNYREFLKFVEDDLYQVIVLGHSCGNTDRTLLRTLFEHKNCCSIKPYYFETENGDNHNELVMSISRIFANKANMRDRVVNKGYCKPIPQNKN